MHGLCVKAPSLAAAPRFHRSPVSGSFAFQPQGVPIAPQSRAYTAARVLLIGLLIGAPVMFGATEVWAWVSLGILTCLALLLWVIGSLRLPTLHLIWSPLYIPIASFIALAFLQYWAGFTLDRSETREALVLMCADVVLFFLAVQLFGLVETESLCRLGLTVIIFTGSLALFAILQFVSGQSRGAVTSASPDFFFGRYGDPDHYAGLMEMLIPVGVLYILGVQEKIRTSARALLVCAVTIAFASLLMSGSRGGLISALVEVLIVLVILRRRSQPIERRALAGAVLAGTASLLLFFWLDPGWVSPRLGLLLKVRSPGFAAWTRSRKSWTSDSLRMLREHPVLGVGLGNFETAFPPYQSLPSDLWIHHTHDDYVEALSETGVAGGVLILSALGMFIWLAFRNLDKRLKSDVGWIRLGSAIGCCGLLVHSFFDYNLHVPANAAWFSVLGGLSVVGEISSRPLELSN